MPKKIDPSLCVRCKGSKLLCGLSKCPILERIASHKKIGRKDYLEGDSPPSALTGERGYPTVWVGPAIEPGELTLPEDPRRWIRTPLHEIVRTMSSRVNVGFKLNVRRVDDPKLEEVRWATLSVEPVGMEAKLVKPISPQLKFDGVLAPVGPRALAKSLIVENEPKIPSKLEKLVYDRDAKANEAIIELYAGGLDVYLIYRALSLGSLGLRVNRRLVPSRWAITATDYIVGNWLKGKLMTMPEYSGDFLLFSSSYEGNRYVVALLPGSLQLEIFEVWLPHGLWTGDEPVVLRNEEARKGLSYMDGGHYAMRLAVFEKLYRIGRQASVLAIREIGPKYFAPVGVWQVREGIRLALRGSPRRFGEIKELISAVNSMLSYKRALHSSILLKHYLYKAIKITDFL